MKKPDEDEGWIQTSNQHSSKTRTSTKMTMRMTVKFLFTSWKADNSRHTHISSQLRFFLRTDWRKILICFLHYILSSLWLANRWDLVFLLCNAVVFITLLVCDDDAGACMHARCCLDWLFYMRIKRLTKKAKVHFLLSTKLTALHYYYYYWSALHCQGKLRQTLVGLLSSLLLHLAAFHCIKSCCTA